MKKIAILCICTLLVCAFVTTAMAASVSFSWDSSSTVFSRWSSTTKADGSTWSLSWTSSNLSSSHQAAVKIYSAPGVYASHTFYYSSKSTQSHPYLSEVTDNTDVYVAGKLYSGTGNITVSGTFNP